MNQDVKRDWIAALRSGEIKQITGSLHTDYGMCCLGVLSNIAPDDVVTCQINRDYNARTYIDMPNNDVSESALVASVQQWSGVDTREGGFKLPAGISFADGSMTVYLSYLNDTGFTFDQIADVIEYFF